ncbi:Bug family tripartite tricarboxylate transporter substrate binding protein [Variovorax arabinosiphilus]|uniref:Bug family tripartite tricarboxylate transporter substrate binding protein n=1 Tax=Variovorax arabinosiphilus TaxID=3053498 RepID=UPI00257493D0|nr:MULTISPECIES: tripartite tricarboxylate transporter substrate binding protein [unclassified Variovorax]MDM0120599.1 tripartite tricarboxylate transporter substrate binding protein [Variovorax sp. J2L1-78]MDM0127489.1 tripartite tricarboxylate transporter substrate binding protein [Variovorax sp. J2L1-63]MDM0231188.1 tripartite tricarboxylate transporter substrate binding protein [Variovorax sp. J2R1-6]
MTSTTLLQRSRHLALGGVMALAATALLPSLAAAQSFPTKPIHIVVPFPPGGSTDLLARRIGEKLAAAWGQPVVVDNRAGAGGTLGADYVAKSAPDGYTLLMGVTGSNAIANALYPKLPYDVVKDFAPVSLVVSSPLVLVRNPGFAGKTVAEVVAMAKAKPGSISCGSPGNGTSMHLTGEMFKLSAKVSMLHIPYRGSAGALSDLMGGQIDTMFGDFLVVWPQLEAGKLQPIAVTSKTRHKMLPNVPTIAESGYPGFEALSWQGLFAPAATPPAVVEQLNREVNKALASADIQEYFGSRGFTLGGSSATEFKAFVKVEADKWAKIVQASGAKPD